MSFARQVAAIARKMNKKTEDVSEAVTIELFSSVISDTRVKTGRARGNWQVSLDQPIDSTTDRLDPTGSEATNEVIKTVKHGKVNYLTNNLHYIRKLEELDAMVGRARSRMSQILSKAVK